MKTSSTDNGDIDLGDQLKGDSGALASDLGDSKDVLANQDQRKPGDNQPESGKGSRHRL